MAWTSSSPEPVSQSAAMDVKSPAMTVYYMEGTPATLGVIQSIQNPGIRCSLAYLNEGGANFVFQFIPTQYRPLPDALRGKLLRLRKNLPHIQKAVDQYDSFHKNFRDLFPPHSVIAQELIRLDEHLPTLLNTLITDLIRPSHRLHDYLPIDELDGLLITDMTPGPEDLLMEIKPKWLLQSPNAPPDSKRCRTCALRALRASQKFRTMADLQEVCPLDIVSGDIDDRIRTAQALTADNELAYWLVHEGQPLLHTLRRYQLTFDPNGALQVTTAESMFDLCKAMTLRDCTLFVRKTEDTVEARLGDLDLKQPERFTRWKKLEQSLISEGWYGNMEPEEVWQPERSCYLSRY